MDWFAVYAKWHHEKSVASYLERAGIEAYLPLRNERHRWKDRFVWVDMPLFPCYLFINCDISRTVHIINRTRGVISVVGSEYPESIPAYQIASIRKILATGVLYEKEEELMIGQEVLVIKGTLKGIRGILTEKRNGATLIVKVELINQGVSVHIRRDQVIPYKSDNPTPCAVLNDTFRMDSA